MWTLPGRSLKKTLRGRRDDWVDEDGPPAFAGGLDTERGPLGLSSRAPRSFFKEAAGQGFLEAVSFYYSPRKLMFRVVISASSSSLRSLPAPVRLSGPVIRSFSLVSFSVPLSLPALASFLGLAFQASPWSVSLFPCPCPPQSAFLASRPGHLCQLASLLLCSGLLQSAFLVSRPGHPPASFSVPLFWPIPGQPLWPIILYIFVVSLDYWA